MSPIIEASAIMFLVGLLHLGSRLLYKWNIRLYAGWKLKRLGYVLEKMQFSLDKIVYAVPLPTNQPNLLYADKDRYRVVEEYDSWIYPQLSGVRVLMKPAQGEEHLVAYLAMDQFRPPLLDDLLMKGQIDRSTYRRIIASKMLSTVAKVEIKEEVYSQIHKKRFT